MACTPKKFRQRWKQFGKDIRLHEKNGWGINMDVAIRLMDKHGLCCNDEYHEWEESKQAKRRKS